MVLVDTSVWISLYRKERTEIGQKIWVLTAANQAAICGQVWVEYIGGFRRRPDRLEQARTFRSFPWLETTRETYERAADLVAEYPRLGFGDALIAATAILTKSELFTLDRDFLILASEGLKLF